jgi:negative modulator of initiation of replication
MPILELDDDVYQYLLRRAVRIGESGSSILRRELNLADPSEGEIDPAAQQPSSVERLDAFLMSTSFLVLRTATDRYLAMLGFLAREHGEGFELVLTLRGGSRRWFGRSREEVANSGKSLHPQQIPGTSLWAMTNADTAQKKTILDCVMASLRWSKDVRGRAASAIG